MTETLEPCPFCGGAAEDASYHSCDCCNKAYNGRVRCLSCGAEISHFDTREQAIAAWNTRPHPSPAAGDGALVEACKPFIAAFEEAEEMYRSRGGKPEEIVDEAPWFDVTRYAGRGLMALTYLGPWRKLRAALSRTPQAPGAPTWEDAREARRILGQVKKYIDTRMANLPKESCTLTGLVDAAIRTMEKPGEKDL